MKPILMMVLKSDRRFADAEGTRAYLDEIQDVRPTLAPYRYALIDVWEQFGGDVRIEIYEQPEAGDDRILMLWLPEHRRAAIKGYDYGEWTWMDAVSLRAACSHFLELAVQFP
ncbi:hypothetical protein SAMN06265338_1382 [Rhodoblastus acidophilus]|uniref:Uncharacterized protein n=1 Tax=Rhodoblastus acidophilus TaxID=1074 RepID=A0A212SG10_RHOAC|nr:hypothetical protein [Rhodoblastus acidophilus]PPQ34810.1 hypothetical protein CKO16_21915 [Rhodoblastus acidophilus]RAI16506.1 hypothetical protein CH337_20975 [Rhodoblastus acidophilus]SNB84667.1 hypothetical protein SAMN06265338_1382 [Rhodoblastus acidophilus]